MICIIPSSGLAIIKNNQHIESEEEGKNEVRWVGAEDS